MTSVVDTHEVVGGARDGFRRALAERSAGPVGTPLGKIYADAYRGPRVVPATTFWGAPMQVVLPDLASCEIHRYGLIEPGLTSLLLDRVTPSAVVYDVGAHLGYYSLLAARLGATVHAFEPSRSALPLLGENVKSRATVVRAGLWSEETELEFKDFGLSHSALNTFIRAKDPSLGEPATTYAAAVTTIDGYVELGGDAPDLIKVDAEGAELEVLRGAAKTMRTARPLITVEVGDADDTPRSRDVIDFAAASGYDAAEVTPHGTRPHAPRDTYSYGNLLLIPR